jgi:transcriptional regulator with XRE-family HTH domain
MTKIPSPPDAPLSPGVPSPLRLHLGRALQQHRLQAGLTQAELADYAGVSTKYVGEVERGQANPTLEVLERLAAAVKWDPLKTLEGLHEPITEGVRLLLIELGQELVEKLQQAVRWLQALDPRLRMAASQDAAQAAVLSPVEHGKRGKLGSALRRLRGR